MSNKYLLKIATISDMGSGDCYSETHSGSNTENSARTAKLVNLAREKQAFFSPEGKKEMAQTGVLMGTGIAAAGAMDHFVKPRVNFSGALGKAKYIGLVGGANLAADYAAVKINNKMNKHLDKA